MGTPGHEEKRGQLKWVSHGHSGTRGETWTADLHRKKGKWAGED